MPSATFAEPVKLSLVMQPAALLRSTLVPAAKAVLQLSVGQGPAGPQGPQGTAGAYTVTYIAGVPLSGHRIVVLNASGEVVYADKDTPAHAVKVLGMTTGAASLGAESIVQCGGEIVEPSWSWTLDAPVFLGNDGLLTQTVPNSGFQLVVGYPLSSTKLMISFREPLFLS